jgi:DNA replication licensing factor MCM6
VLEAYNLLRQSIISVERDDVDIDDDELPLANGDAAMADDADAPEASAYAEAQQREPSATPAPPSRRMKVTFERFAQMQHALATRVRDYEEAEGEGISHEDLILWYMEQQESEIDSIEDLAQEKKLTQKVVKKMVKVSFICFGFVT